MNTETDSLAKQSLFFFDYGSIHGLTLGLRPLSILMKYVWQKKKQFYININNDISNF